MQVACCETFSPNCHTNVIQILYLNFGLLEPLRQHVDSRPVLGLPTKNGPAALPKCFVLLSFFHSLCYGSGRMRSHLIYQISVCPFPNVATILELSQVSLHIPD
jgi:hypothetical protein